MHTKTFQRASAREHKHKIFSFSSFSHRQIEALAEGEEVLGLRANGPATIGHVSVTHSLVSLVLQTNRRCYDDVHGGQFMTMRCMMAS